tara:strand:+ start:216 stop:1037 length:822 start_codon:yes stop_codon:yes gene_type:complete
MKKILVFGSNGMLGSQLINQLNQIDHLDLYYTSRSLKNGSNNEIKFTIENNNEFDFKFLDNFDYIINCIGIVKPVIDKDYINSIIVNSLFPHSLSNYCKSKKIKLIHITTDCVFSGKKGKYLENDVHDCDDFYGKSKSIGEPNNCMVIRTSIIGYEIKNFYSLISWILSNKNGEVNGFTNHYWNGTTTNYLSKIILNIIENDRYLEGLFHIYSPDDISKFNLLKLVNSKLNLNIKINQVEANESIDRTLRSINDLSGLVCKLTIEDQIKQMTK